MRFFRMCWMGVWCREGGGSGVGGWGELMFANRGSMEGETVWSPARTQDGVSRGIWGRGEVW